MTTAETAGERAPKSGKYLSFFLGQEEYGTDILQVREITIPLPVTPVPRAPAHILGVSNLRGKITPVVDLKLRLGIGHTVPGPLSCFVILKTHSRDVAILVDRVNEVRQITEREMRPAPQFGSAAELGFISALCDSATGLKLLIDLEKLLSLEELDATAHNLPPHGGQS